MNNSTFETVDLVERLREAAKMPFWAYADLVKAAADEIERMRVSKDAHDKLCKGENSL